MTTTIEVTAIRPPKEGKKVGTVVASTGQSFEIWPDKMAGIKEGGRYEVEIKEREWNSRTIRQITRAKEVGSAATGTSPIQTAPPLPAGEQAFIAAVLNGALIGGHVKFEPGALAREVRMLQLLYSQAFGGQDRVSEALSQYRGTQQ